MKATALIDLAKSKGYGIGRKRAGNYETHSVINGKHVTQDFFGTWAQFVKHIKSL